MCNNFFIITSFGIHQNISEGFFTCTKVFLFLRLNGTRITDLPTNITGELLRYGLGAYFCHKAIKGA